MLELPTPIVSVDWLAQHITDPDLIILDASIKKVTENNALENNDIQIKGARFFDIKKSFSDKNTTLPNMLPPAKEFELACRNLGISNHHSIVIYDTLGIYSSPRAWWMFTTMGYHNVSILDGGLPEWIQAGLPTENKVDHSKDYKKGDFKAIKNSEMVVDAENILSEMNNPSTLILDARSSDRFYGITPEPRNDLKSGHIPNAINIPYTRVVKNGKMLSKERLKDVFSTIDIKNKKLIFSCGSGITACIILLAAQLSGYTKLSIYDGSWTEWGQLDNVPIECSPHKT